MNIVYLGGKQAGVIGLLTLLAHQNKIQGVVAYDEAVKKVADAYKLPVYSALKDMTWVFPIDLLVSVHGREIVSKEILSWPKLGAINVHPCLYAFKGANPIKRFLESSYFPRASVGVHYMTEKVDDGKVIKEIFVDVSGCSTEVEVYNTLYPYYSLALSEALKEV